MTYMFQIGEGAIHRIFVLWLIFMEVIFWCLYLRSNDEFLPYSMAGAFNKTEHGLADIVVAWAESIPVLLTEFFGHNGTCIYWVLE